MNYFSRLARAGCLAVLLGQLAPAGRAQPSTCIGAARAQDDVGCGTRVRAEDVQVARYLQRVGAYERHGPAPRYLPQIPVTIHVVRHFDGSGGMTREEIDETLADANARCTEMGMQFFQRGATHNIDDETLRNIDNEVELEALRVIHQVADTVNIFFVDEIDLWFTDLSCAISTFSYQPTQGIVFKKVCSARGGNRHTLAHELGHYFDLYHTHETQFGAECPDGSNCANAGDLLCDTPADPNCRETVDRDTCEYSGTDTRCGDPFEPDTRNQMAYAGRCCLHFTPQQRSRALGTLLNLRAALFESGNPGVVWVDFGVGGSPDGSYAHPWPTLDRALDDVSSGGRIVMLPGSTDETPILTGAVILDSFGGSAVVGQ